MALRDFKPQRTDIKYHGDVLFSVRGLNLDDISILVRRYLPDLNQLVDLFNGEQAELFTSLQRDGYILKLITDMPMLAAEAICLASYDNVHEASADDDADASLIETARTLPLATQVKAMVEIVRLTFEDIGGPKEFAALIRGMTETPK